MYCRYRILHTLSTSVEGTKYGYVNFLTPFSTLISFSRETSSRHTLTITARDRTTFEGRNDDLNPGGVVPARGRVANASVVVTVLDDNDNHPVFEKASYHFFVSEALDHRDGPSFGQVCAIDKDEGSNAVVR